MWSTGCLGPLGCGGRRKGAGQGGWVLPSGFCFAQTLMAPWFTLGLVMGRQTRGAIGEAVVSAFHILSTYILGMKESQSSSKV